MKAIVFDKSGTFVDTMRVAYDLSSGEVFAGVSSACIVDNMEKGALLILEKSVSADILAEDPLTPFDDFCRARSLHLKDVYANTDEPVDADGALETCHHVTMSLFQHVLGRLRDMVGEVRTNIGVVYDVGNRCPTHVLCTGGCVYPGVKELFSYLRERGWHIYIATGDTLEGMREISVTLDIPCRNIFCFQTEPKKAESIRMLKNSYDTVVMVGNDSNDLAAFRVADRSVLVLQDGLEKKRELYEVAHHVVASITDIRCLF
ncbi:MAG: HAD family hydrolase [Candidatus Methanofastidiosa archaeon]|nr:HAD family hydrolase [Candidatus Methanofastidiosa archaeon]